MTLPFLEKVNAETSTKKIFNFTKIQKKTSQDLSRNSKGYHHKI
jgi:hypothetical protein